MAEEYRVLSATPHIAGHPPERVCEHNSLDEWLADPARMPARGEASLVLEFTRGPVRVTSVDVCNAGSALVEVLVFNAPQPQQQPRLSVLLPVKILLSPPECKGRVNRNRTVRFEAKDFTAEPARQSWERVKIVLRNPFVDNEPFGLCFVRFNASSSSSSSVPAPLPPVEKKKPAAAASFVAVPPVEEPMHAAAAAAEPSVALETPRMSDAARVALRSPVKPLRPPKPTAPAAAAPAEHSANTTADLPPPDLPTEPMLPRVGAADSPRKARDSSSSSAAAAAAGDEQRVFHGVVLSISGIPNPERSELRSIALGLGGRYEDDAQHATHLICAFRDSPKYFIAKEHGGLIVTKQWLYDCDKVKCRLPESDYALDDGLQASDDDTSAAAVAAAASPKKKSARSVATDKSGRKRRRKKKGADGDEPDSEYESSGPDEYDLADSFIDNRPASEIDEGSAGTSTDSSRSSTADEGDTEMRELLREGRRFVHDGGGGGHLRRHRAAAPDFRRVKLPEDFNTDDEDDEDFTGTDARMAAGDEAEAERKWLQEHAGDVRIPAQPEQRHREPPPRRHSPPHPHPPAVAAAAASAKAARPPERKPVTSAPAPKPKAPARMDDGYETEPMEDAELLDSLSNVVPRSDAESAVKERRKSRKQGQAPVQVAAAVVKPKVDKTGRLLGKDGPIRKLPEFLSGVGALIFGEMDAARRRQLVRIIVAFGGKALEAMTEETTHVVTELPWDTALQDAQETHPGLSIVRPSWLEACYEQRKQIPAVGHFVHA